MKHLIVPRGTLKFNIMFKTQYNFEFSKIHTEKISEKQSKTVPDLAYTVRELLEKFTTGGIPPIQHGVLDELEDITEVPENDIDLVDIMLSRQKVTDLKEKLKQEQVAEMKAKQAKQAKLLAQREESLKAREAKLISDKNVVPTE